MINKQRGSAEGLLIGGMFMFLFVVLQLFLALFTIDWQTGEHGRLTITSVDKNLFGTYTIYARNSDSMSGVELNEVRYCIDAENTDLANKAKELVGTQNVKLVYPDKRIGFVWFDECSTAPIKDIVVK